MASKRGREPEEFDDVAYVVNASPNAKIHAVVMIVSPLKKGRTCSYFDGEISDGQAKMRVFGFDSGVRRKLLDYEGKEDAVMLSHCEVKRARQGDELEVLVTKFTKVEKSPKSFDVSKGATCENVVEVSKVKELASFERVTVQEKAVRVDDSIDVSGGKRKQDILVADASGNVRLTVWEAEVGNVKEGASYRLGGLMVRDYRGMKNFVDWKGEFEN